MGISTSADQRGRAARNGAERAFLVAAQSGNSHGLEELLCHVSPSERRALLRATSGRSALTSTHWCAKLGNVDGLSILLKAGASPEQRTADGRTPLMLAVLAGNVDCVHLLLSRGSSVNATTEWGDSALHFAAQCASPQGINCLQLLLRFGADVNIKCNNGWSPLHWAARERHPESVKGLLAAGCPVDTMDHLRVTALGEAAREGCLEAVNTLVAANASVNQRDISDNLPLHEAVVNGHVDCAAALLKAGTVPNERGSKWDTALHMAIQENQPACVQLLLEVGANPLLTNKSKQSCREVACSAQCHVRCLFEDYVQFLDCGQWCKSAEWERLCGENPTTVWPLSKLCRFVIRHALGPCRVNQIDMLPLSSPVKNFLLYKNVPTDESVETAPDLLAASGLILRSSKLLLMKRV